MSSQLEMWNSYHANGGHDEYRIEPSEFAVRVNSDIDAEGRLLELGCGVGVDASYFADSGHSVTATDFSDIVIAQNADRFEGVEFIVHDIADPLPFEDAEFDYVFANLSLHYFNDEVTRTVFAEIARVLKPGGVLYFRCKSIESIEEKNNAEEVEDNVFMRKGHLRHLFSTEYIEDITRGLFDLEKNEYYEDMAYGHHSYFVEAKGRRL